MKLTRRRIRKKTSRVKRRKVRRKTKKRRKSFRRKKTKGGMWGDNRAKRLAEIDGERRRERERLERDRRLRVPRDQQLYLEMEEGGEGKKKPIRSIRQVNHLDAENNARLLMQEVEARQLEPPPALTRARDKNRLALKVEKLIKKGNDNWFVDNIDDAELYYSGAIKLDPKNKTALRRLGFMEKQKKNREEKQRLDREEEEAAAAHAEKRTEPESHDRKKRLPTINEEGGGGGGGGVR